MENNNVLLQQYNAQSNNAIGSVGNISFVHSDGYRDYKGNGDFQHYDLGTKGGSNSGGGGSSGGGNGGSGEDGCCSGIAYLGIFALCICACLNPEVVGDALGGIFTGLLDSLCDSCC